MLASGARRIFREDWDLSVNFQVVYAVVDSIRSLSSAFDDDSSALAPVHVPAGMHGGALLQLSD